MIPNLEGKYAHWQQSPIKRLIERVVPMPGDGSENAVVWSLKLMLNRQPVLLQP